MRILVVNALERLCDKTGHRFGCRLAFLSLDLDDRWGTQQWTGPDPKID